VDPRPLARPARETRGRVNPASLADFAKRAARVEELCARPWIGPENTGTPVKIGHVMRGQDIGGLPPTLYGKLKRILIEANKVLEAYPLHSSEDYHLLSPQDREELRCIYKRIPDLVPARHRQK
jgi:hypothetical protein